MFTTEFERTRSVNEVPPRLRRLGYRQALDMEKVMPHSTIPDWVAYLMSAVGGGALFKLLDWWNARRRIAMEGDKTLQDVIDRRVKMVLEDDEKTILRLSEQVNELQAYVEILIRVLRKAGLSIPEMTVSKESQNAISPEPRSDKNISGSV